MNIVVSTAHGETKPGRKTWFYFDLTAVIAPQLFAGLITCVALPSGVDGLPWVFLDGSVPRSGTGTQHTLGAFACQVWLVKCGIYCIKCQWLGTAGQAAN